jgi:hypothetical protein
MTDQTRVTTLVSALKRHLLRADQPDRLALGGGAAERWVAREFAAGKIQAKRVDEPFVRPKCPK